MIEELDISGPPEVLDKLRSLGRIEDIDFSPDGSRMVIAGFASDTIHVLDVNFVGTDELEVHSVLDVRSPTLKSPHGAAFAGRDRLVVSNRLGLVVVLDAPPARRPVDAVQSLEPISIAPPPANYWSPGSVRRLWSDEESGEYLVCDNVDHSVTRYTYDARTGISSPGQTVVRHSLNLPDGIAISHDRAVIAVSNHDSNRVLLFGYSCDLGPETPPIAELHGVSHPHGLCFSADDRALIVADAGSPFVHVFARESEGWPIFDMPTHAVRIMDVETFLKGHGNPEEGGPKGISIDPSGRFISVVSEYQGLAVFRSCDILAHLWTGADGSEHPPSEVNIVRS